MTSEYYDTLSAREKGDIYWRKLKYYLRAVKEKDIETENRRSGSFMAGETFSLDTSELKKEIEQGTRHITGNEFRHRPPTATGELAYKQSIQLVKLSSEYFKERLAKADKQDEDDSNKVLRDNLEKLIPLMDGAVDTWFSANGINSRTGEKESPEIISEAKNKLDEEIQKYENGVKNFRVNIAKKIAAELLSGGPESRDKSEEPENSFSEIISENIEKYEKNRDSIDKAVRDHMACRKVISAIEGEIDRLKVIVEQKGKYEKVNLIMTYRDVFREYRDMAQEKLKLSVWAQYGCEGLIRGLLLDEPADPKVAKYIESHYSVKVPVYSQYQRISELPGYVSHSDKLDADIEEYGISDMEEMEKALSRLRTYKKEHPDQFSCQTIHSMLFGTNELPEIATLAKQLRNYIAGSMKAGEFSGMSESEKHDLFEKWVFSDTMARVSYMVIEYGRKSEKKTISDLLLTFENDRREMEFAYQEKMCRESIEECLMRRRKTK